MTRWHAARRLIWFSLNQILHALRLILSALAPSSQHALERKLGNFLSGAISPFDQSNSNREIGCKVTASHQNMLFDQLCATAAAVYGAPFARISLGGSSKSIHQIIGHTIPRARLGKSLILLDPACHKSVFGGLIESGHDVVFLRRIHSHSFGITAPIDMTHFRSCFLKHRANVAAVIVTDPTYEGYSTDLSDISSMCNTDDVLLCIDCAWGSNFGIVSGLPNCPISFADIVITSPHKKGAAPSQVGLVLFRSPLLVKLFDEASRAGCETTSPNWLLLLIFEHRLQEVIEGRWDTAWKKAIEEANTFRQNLNQIDPKLESPHPKLLGFVDHDPTHVFVCTASIGLNGIDLCETLSSEFQIDPEMASPNGVLFLFGPTHAGKSAYLTGAIKKAIDTLEPEKKNCVSVSATRSEAHNSSLIQPRAAYFSDVLTLPIEQCEGRISASLIYAYPPGIPLLAYGERVTTEHINTISRSSEKGLRLTGIPTDLRIGVTRAPPKLAARKRRPRHTPTSSEKMKTVSTSENLEIRGYPFGKAPATIVDEVAHLFREIFCNPPYNQFAAHNDDPSTPLSFAEIAPAGYAAIDEYQSLELLDATKLPAGCFRWMKPGEFEDRFRAKAHQLNIVTGHDPISNQLKAFIVCRVLTVRELFFTEEIRNPIYYSGREYIRTLRSSAEFYKLMRFHFGLSPDDKLWWIIGMGAHPSARGENFVFPGMNIISDHIQEQYLEIPSIGEVALSGAGRIHGEAVHDGVIHGVLQNDHALIYARTLKSVVDNYRKGPAHVDALIKDKIKIARDGLDPYPTDHPHIELRKTTAKGTGVFATSTIRRGELIAEFIGHEYTAEKESELPEIMVDRCIQVGPKTYVFAENRLAEKINHSCAPNCGVREKTKIVAIREINEGEEITWDYRMSENSDWVLEHCQCGAERCARSIEGYDSLPEEIRQEYLQKGAISSWLLDR